MPKTTIPFALTVLAITTLPLFFLNLTPNPFETNKALFITVIDLLLFIILILQATKHKAIVFRSSPIHLPLTLFLTSQLVSLIVASPSKPLSVATELFPLLIVAAYFFLAFNFTPSALEKRKLSLLLPVIPTTLLSLFFIIQRFFDSLLPSYLHLSSLPSPAGTQITLISLLAISSALIVSQLFTSSKSINKHQNIKQSIGLLLLGIVLALHILVGFLNFQTLPLTSLSPSLNTSWTVALETIKRFPLLGTGPGSFTNSYFQYRPLSAINPQIWQLRFPSSHNTFSHYATTSGLLGFLSYAFLAYRIAMRPLLEFEKFLAVPKELTPLPIAILVALVAHIFTPGNLLTLFALLSLLIFYHAPSARLSVLELKNRETLAFLQITSVVIIILTSTAVTQTYAAELYLQRANLALATGDGGNAYKYLKSAIAKSPKIDFYHLLLSNVDLLLAQSVSNKPDPTPADKSIATSLVEESIIEAKTAVNLNPLNTRNWLGLANIYIKIIPQVKQAQSWAQASLTRAAQLDPLNPTIYFDLGSLNFQTGNYELAELAFSKAILILPTYANAHYNLAAVYQAEGKLEAARDQLDQTLTLLPPDSTDREIVQAALNSIQTAPLLPAQTDSLNLPPPLPNPVEPKISLPDNSGPDLTPTPSLMSAPTPIPPTLTPSPTLTP